MISKDCKSAVQQQNCATVFFYSAGIWIKCWKCLLKLKKEKKKKESWFDPIVFCRSSGSLEPWAKCWGQTTLLFKKEGKKSWFDSIGFCRSSRSLELWVWAQCRGRTTLSFNCFFNRGLTRLFFCRSSGSLEPWAQCRGQTTLSTWSTGGKPNTRCSRGSSRNDHPPTDRRQTGNCVSVHLGSDSLHRQKRWSKLSGRPNVKAKKEQIITATSNLAATHSSADRNIISDWGRGICNAFNQHPFPRPRKLVCLGCGTNDHQTIHHYTSSPPANSPPDFSPPDKWRTQTIHHRQSQYVLLVDILCSVS